MKYLNADWEKIRESLSNKHLYLFLDYDGTLTKIAKSPGEAIIPADTKKLLRELSQISCFKLAIISGRALKDIKRVVGLKKIIFAGNHGLEIEGPKIRFKSMASLDYEQALKKIKGDFKKKLSKIKGVILEDKGMSLSLHYRLVNKKEVGQVRTIFHESVISYLLKNKIRIKPGKMVLEIRPPLKWDKGRVCLWLLSRQSYALKEREALPIYLGDDTSDEDAFQALRDKGITIFVGKPKKSAAKYYLRNSEDVFKFLERILKLKKEESKCQS